MAGEFAIPAGLNGGIWRPDGTVDLQTLNGVFKSRRIAQDDEPTLVSGELAIWNDTDGSNVYLAYNDPDDGQKKISLSTGVPTSLGDLSDVEIDSPSANEVLAYDGDSWDNVSSLTLTNITLSGIYDQDVTTSQTSGSFAGVDVSVTADGTLDGDLYVTGINLSTVFSGTKGAHDATVVGTTVYSEASSDAGSGGVVGAEAWAHASATQTGSVIGLKVLATKGAFENVPTAYGIYVDSVQATTKWAMYNASGEDNYLGSGKNYVGSATAITGQGDIVLRKNGVIAMIETTTPTADTSFGKLYTKSDNKLYFQDGAGSEHEVAFAP